MENSLYIYCIGIVCLRISLFIVILGGWLGDVNICCWNICGLCNAFKVMDRYTQNVHTHTYKYGKYSRTLKMNNIFVEKTMLKC